MSQLSFHSPVGDLTLSAEDDKIVSLDWGWSPLSEKTAFLWEVKQQVDAYFDGLMRIRIAAKTRSSLAVRSCSHCKRWSPANCRRAIRA